MSRTESRSRLPILGLYQTHDLQYPNNLAMRGTASLHGSLQGAGKRFLSSQSRRVWPSSHDLPRKRPLGEDSQADQVTWDLAQTQLRPRIDADSKTIATPSGDLPISPLMDERGLKAQRKRRLPKPAADKSQNGIFERRLEDNPYATALGTPIRLDAATNTILPRFFFQDFHFVNHPETNAPWFTPTSLLQSSDQPTRDRSASEQSTMNSDRIYEAIVAPDGEADGVESPEAPADASAEELSKEPSNTSRPETAGAYAMFRRDLFTALVGGEGVPQGLKQYRNRHAKMANFARQARAVWRADMDEVVLDLTRARVLKSLLYLARFDDDPVDPRHYIVRCQAESLEAEDWAKHEFRGCVLWLGGGEANSAPPPKEFEIIPVPNVRRNTALPVHDLNGLLGAKAVERLRAESVIFREGAFFLLSRARTKQLQMWLWKLQGYLAEYPEFQ
ncbi:hypothetical protein GGTG_10859 [Gaeumannomyces tritici R3-111a-1]|uniref:Uncharacterized protein n=1 Tax=Gaeumannomyces tritici (strain R3-111a-1) TaxID=644352 RepID=J3PBI7_GAET3|nr:hypothetical protein GGTG_10859 [Gaeumannomyces tritici R3-111a-1]EJT71604.1 hypothetical protein GGTG_10859 [Gaeumannomyces tritici R3-111a-1]